MPTRSLALATLFCGLIVMGLSVVFMSLGMRTVEPLNGAYGDQAILAFELARTPAELAAVIGTNPPTAEAAVVRQTMDAANRLDFLYMTSYCAFIVFACLCAARERRRSWVLIGALLAPVATLGDVAENLVLLQLTEPQAQWMALLPSLHFRTLLKWEFLAVVSAVFALAFVQRGRFAVNVSAMATAGLAIVSGVLTVFDPATYLALLSGVIVVVWLWQLGYAIVTLNAPLVKLAH